MAVFAAGTVAGFLACQKGREVDEAEVVARVGDAVLTVADLERLDADQRKIKMPSYLTKEEIMEEWVRSEVLYQHALEEGVDKEDECAWRLSNSAKGIVIERFWELNIYEKYPDVSDEDALAWYEANKAKQYRAKQTGVWLRRILLNSRKSADDVMRRLKAGEDFAAITRKESVTPEKLEAGNQGYRRLQDIAPTYRDAVARMKDGDVAGPFEMGNFFVILKLEDRVEPGDYLKPEGIGLAQLRDRARADRWREKAARIGTDLEAAADVERHPERIPEKAADMALGEERAPAASAEAK
jgi:peptidyl-prolyl cis-trans isomerase C